MTEKEQVQMAQAIRAMNEGIVPVIEFQKYQAKIMRAKFVALMNEGFNEAQALILCRQ